MRKTAITYGTSHIIDEFLDKFEFEIPSDWSKLPFDNTVESLEFLALKGAVFNRKEKPVFLFSYWNKLHEVQCNVLQARQLITTISNSLRNNFNFNRKTCKVSYYHVGVGEHTVSFDYNVARECLIEFYNTHPILTREYNLRNCNNFDGMLKEVLSRKDSPINFKNVL